MPTHCVVNLDDLLTIPIIALEDRITTLSKAKMDEVRDAIIFALDLA
jgi:mRNA-degrading endonuclease toxin of MazEF toxin-antitoxin module